MKVKSLIGIMITAAALVIGASGCTGASAGSPSSFKVGTWKTAQTIQPFMYEKNIESGNKVEVLSFTNPGDQKTALLAGDLDMCGTTWVTAIMAASKGEPIKAVGSMTSKCSALVVRKDSGINEVADLKGKSIAYVPGTMHHILLLQTLKQAGLDPDKDVTMKRIDFFDMSQALESKEVDAFCSGEPFPSKTVVDGYGKILIYPYYGVESSSCSCEDCEEPHDGTDFADGIGYINAAIITTEDEIANNPEGLQKLVSAHVKSTKYLMANKSEWLKMASEFGTDISVLEAAAGNMELSYDVTPEMVKQVKNLAYHMKDLGMIDNVPDMDAMFDLSFLEKAKSE